MEVADFYARSWISRDRAAVRRLIAHGQQARFGPSAEELAEEAVAVGFTLDRIAGTDFGRMVVVTK